MLSELRSSHLILALRTRDSGRFGNIHFAFADLFSLSSDPEPHLDANTIMTLNNQSKGVSKKARRGPGKKNGLGSSVVKMEEKTEGGERSKITKPARPKAIPSDLVPKTSTPVASKRPLIPSDFFSKLNKKHRKHLHIILSKSTALRHIQLEAMVPEEPRPLVDETLDTDLLLAFPENGKVESANDAAPQLPQEDKLRDNQKNSGSKSQKSIDNAMPIKNLTAMLRFASRTLDLGES